MLMRKFDFHLPSGKKVWSTRALSKPPMGPQSRPRARAAPLRAGGDGPVTSLVTGCFHLDPGAAGRFLAALPRLVHFPSADPVSAPWLGATVQLIVAESAA